MAPRISPAPLRRRMRFVIASLLLLTTLYDPFAGQAAAEPVSLPQFAAPAFECTWSRWDRPVYRSEANRSYTWGN